MQLHTNLPALQITVRISNVKDVCKHQAQRVSTHAVRQVMLNLFPHDGRKPIKETWSCLSRAGQCACALSLCGPSLLGACLVFRDLFFLSIKSKDRTCRNIISTQLKLSVKLLCEDLTSCQTHITRGVDWPTS